MRLVIASALLLTAAACQQPAPKADEPAKVDTAAAAADIKAAEDAQIAAINAKDTAKATASYAEDAVFIGDDGKLVAGSAAIAEAFGGFLPDPALKIDYQPGEKTFSDDGSMAYATATYSETITDPATKKVVTLTGTNLSVWRRQADGSWKLVADSNPGKAAAN